MNINETLLRENDQWILFSEPHRIITAYEIDEVFPALQEVENLIQPNRWHAAGFVSYEAAPAFDKAFHPLTAHRSAQDGFPLLWFGLYSQPRILTLPEPDPGMETLSWLPTVDRVTYNYAIEKIKEHIAEGRTYQVNYTMRLQAEFKSDPFNLFLRLAQSQNNHAAYINMGRYVVCSASPELFFDLDGDTITSRPMKGTIHRGRTTLEDEKQAQALKDSEKNRAENVMIVDMVRNDLGRIARAGSVSVPALFSVERYPTLWQMTSTVQAKSSASISEIFKALFPCASITGAPKVSTMRIISELETTPRRIYTGSIGHIAPNRKAKFSVAIRTALIDSEMQTAEYGVGGGIIWDSTSADEYDEAIIKARVLTEERPQFSLFETILWTPEEGFFLRKKHISRLMDSAIYFDFPITEGQVENHLDQLSSQFNCPQRVRLLLDKNGNLNSEAIPVQNSSETSPMKACLAIKSVHSNNIFLFHKTTHREMYASAHQDFPNYDDVLLYNENYELTEFTIGNLVVEMGGKFYTPPISCGLLAGTFRAHLLETGQAEERVIRVEELEFCRKVFLVNSLRKWQRVEIEQAKLAYNHQI